MTDQSRYLTPEQLEYGLLNNTIDQLELDKLLTNFIHENENIDTLVQFFLQYIPGNRTMDEFLNKIREYNSAQICGLVWNTNVIAYRCKTCSISPCMSICAQCFHHGNHEGHNYNMFKSQAGGACDCGDSSVMHEFGFCRFHGENRPQIQSVPRDLTCCAEFLIPHLLKVFIRALRMGTVSGDIVTEQKLLEILNQLSNGGSALQIFITKTLTDQQLYEEFISNPSMNRPYHSEYLTDEYSRLPDSFFVPSLMSDENSSTNYIPFDTRLRTMLDEIMMWCVETNLPEDLVRFLLSLLPDLNFKLLFTETFLRFYGVIAQKLIEESFTETNNELPSRLVHISVQLFSSNIITDYAMEKCHLIEVILSCIWHMFSPLVDVDRQEDDLEDSLLKIHPLTTSDSESSNGFVVDVEHPLIIKNVYWPLLSDFVNILSQEKVAISILENKRYFNLWLRFLKLFQGMNVNERVLIEHIEYEPRAYMYAFTIELEISAAAMWCFVNHFNSNFSREKLINVIKQIIENINDWLQSLNFDLENTNPSKLTFHLPLHRYLSVFIYNAVYKYDIHPSEFLPIDNQTALLNLIFHPLRTLAGYYEVLSNIWLRNGQQVTIQAKTYAKSTFSSSMHDADLFLVQLISSFIEPNIFVEHLLKSFHVYPWIFQSTNELNLDPSQQISMLESCLMILSAIVAFQPNITLRETPYIRAEIISILAVADRLYSEVEENVPDPSPLAANRKEIETILEQVSDFQTPSVELLGHLQQGKYTIKGLVLEKEYDPLHVIMRCPKRAHFQNSLERFTNYVKHQGLFKTDYPIWPPFRQTGLCPTSKVHVEQIFNSNILQEFFFLCLNGYLNDKSITENILYFTIYLIELSISCTNEISKEKSKSILSSIRSSSNPSETLVTILLEILHKQRPNDYLDLIVRLSNQLKIRQNSRIGDSYHFLSNLFQLIVEIDQEYFNLIQKEIEKLKLQFQQKQTTVTTKTSDLTAEQKRQRAKNRQQKLLAEIAKSQQEFISQQNPDDHMMLVGTPPSLSNEAFSLEQQLTTTASSQSQIIIPLDNFNDYECCVCRLSKSDSESPMGLIGISCLSILPTFQIAQLDDDEQNILDIHSDKITLENYLEITKDHLTKISGHPYIANFCQNDFYLRSSLVQSCGHSLHIDCLSSYLKALYPNQAGAASVSIHNLLPRKIVFRCPLCRQTANALIPLFDYNDYSTYQNLQQELEPIHRLHQAMANPKRSQLKRNDDQSCLYAFLQGLESRCIPLGRYTPNNPVALKNHQSMKQRSADFNCGTLRAQLVHEQLFYESVSRIDQKNVRKSYYKILHDLHHLGYPFHHQRLWEEISGLSCPINTIDVFDPHENLPPLLLRDSLTILLQLLMSAPMNLPSDEFDVLIQIVFNLEFYKNLLSIVLQQSIDCQELFNSNIHADFVVQFLKETFQSEFKPSKKILDSTVEHFLMKTCVQFLKTSSLIKYRLYSKEMPWITGEEPSVLALADYLNLKLNLNGLVLPQWFCDNSMDLLTKWFQDFRIIARQYSKSVQILSLRSPRFAPPNFISLPEKYDDVFHLYNDYQCQFCQTVASNTLLCLICGQLYFKPKHASCCEEQKQRYSQHLTKCGHPAAVMLDIQTTLIMICLADTYGSWHSLYLDQHGEEDPKLKRGKTLYLNVKRLAVLRTLWLTATFDYQIQNWYPYNTLMITHFDVLL